MRRHDLKKCQKILGHHIEKAASSQQNSPNGISPTPSPAGSEGSVCSKSSGYTSAGEGNGRLGGVMTPPAGNGLGGTQGGPTLSVPHSIMAQQHQFCNYLTQCHELWEMADVYKKKGHCKGIDYIIFG